MISDLELLEKLITSYKRETDSKKKHVLYLNLVDEALKLVKKIVLSIYPIPPTVTKDDLLQVGALGVLKSIDSYIIETKGSFKTYASKVVRGQILHYLRDKANIVRFPRETVENLSKVKNAMEYFGMDENSADSELLAKHLNISVTTVEEILNLEQIKYLVSLDQSTFNDGEGSETLMDRIQDDDYKNFEDVYANKKIIEFAIMKLDETDRKVITMCYIEGIAQKDIAKKLKMSQPQVSRIIKRSLSKLYFIIQKELEENKV